MPRGAPRGSSASERGHRAGERALAKTLRSDARSRCSVSLRDARALGSSVDRRRAELAAERLYQADMRKIEQDNRSRRRAERPRATAAERRAESDDEVIGNLDPSLVALFLRVRRGIRASDRQSRTEAFLKYAEEHPSEVLRAIEDRSEEELRRLEREEREARLALARIPVRAPRRAFSAAELAATPF